MFGACNNLSKSGYKNPNLQKESPGEQEHGTWLQPPQEDGFVKTYCSDMFDRWPRVPPTMPTSGEATRSTEKDAKHAKLPPVSASMAMESSRLFTATKPSVRQQLCSGNEMGIMSGFKSNVQARGFGNSSVVNRTDSVDGALALGAKRAAGLDMGTGSHAFTKVKTSFQQPHTDVNASSGNAQRYNVPGMSSKIGNCHAPTHAGGKPSLGNHVSWPMFNPRCQISKSNTPGLGSGSERVPETVHLQSPKAKHADNSHAPPNATAQNRPANKHQENPDKGGVGLRTHNPLTGETHGPCNERVADMCSEDMQLKSSNTQQTQCSQIIPESNAHRVAGHQRNQHHQAIQESGEMPPSTCSGSGSQGSASADLSVRDVKVSRKRKHQSTECQSDDADDESMEIKQPRRQSNTCKRNRAAEVHNLSERNRRNRINEKLKTLQELIPNSTKTDKASVLDEAIEYMKTLQMQLQMVSMRSAMDMSQMMVPMSMTHLQMAPLPAMGFGVPLSHAGMGMGMGMGLMDLSQNMMSRPFQSVPTAVNAHPGIPFQDGVMISSTTATHAEPRQAFGRTDVMEHVSQMSQNSTQTLASFSQDLQNEQGQHLFHHSRGHGSRD